MKTLNKLFLFGLMALALSFGAYAMDGDSQQQAAADQSTKTSAKLKDLTAVGFKAVTLWVENHSSQSMVSIGTNAYGCVANFMQKPAVASLLSSVDTYGSALIDNSVDYAQKFRANPAASIRFSAIYAIQTAKSIFSSGEKVCANLERRFSKVEEKKAE